MSVYALLQGHIATAVGVMLELHCENSSYISNKKTDKQTANKVLQLCVCEGFAEKYCGVKRCSLDVFQMRKTRSRSCLYSLSI